MKHIPMRLEELERWEPAGNLLGEAAVGAALIDPIGIVAVLTSHPRLPAPAVGAGTSVSLEQLDTLGTPDTPIELSPPRAIPRSDTGVGGGNPLFARSERGGHEEIGDLAIVLLDDFWLAFTPEATSESSADGNSSGANAGGTAGPGAPITPTSGIAPTKALSFSPSGASNGPAAHGQVQPLRFERSQPAAPTAGEPLMTMSSTLPEVTIEAIDWTASESGESTGAFRVSRTGDTGAALTVYYEVSGTADEDDYHETLADPNTGIGSVTIPAGAYSAAIKVTPVADETPEDWEYVEVSLTFSGGGSGGSGGGDPTYTIGDPWFDYVDIADESYDGTSGGGPGVPGDPVVWIGAVDPNASEFGTSTAAYKVSRDGSDFSSPLEVEVYVGGQAMAGGIDYSGLAEAWQTVTIPSGETSVTLKVTPVDDTGTTGDNGEFDEPVRMLLPDPAAGAGYTIDSSYFVNLDIRDAKPDYRIVPGPHPRKLKTQVVNNRHVPIYQVAGNGNGTASVVNYGEGALNDDNNTGVPLKVNWVSMDMSFTKAGPIDTTFEALPTNGTTEFRFEVVVINLTGQFQDSLFFELGFLVDGQFIPVNDNTGLDFDTPHKDPTPEDSNKKFAGGIFTHTQGVLGWVGTQPPDEGHGIVAQPLKLAVASMFFNVDIPELHSSFPEQVKTPLGGYKFTVRTTLMQQ